MQRITDLDIKPMAKAEKLRQQPINIIPPALDGNAAHGLRGAIAVLRHMISFLVLGEAEQDETANDQLISDIIALESRNPVIQFIFVDMPTSDDLDQIAMLQEALHDIILMNPEYRDNCSFNGIMESPTMQQTLWSLPRLTFIRATPNNNTSLRTWNGDSSLGPFIISEFTISGQTPSAGTETTGIKSRKQPNSPTFFRLLFKPNWWASRTMNDLRTVTVSSSTDTTPQQPQNYLLIAIAKIPTPEDPTTKIHLYDRTDQALDPNNKSAARHVVPGSALLPISGAYLLYYSKLRPDYYFSNAHRTHTGSVSVSAGVGSSNIPLYSIEHGHGEYTYADDGGDGKQWEFEFVPVEEGDHEGGSCDPRRVPSRQAEQIHSPDPESEPAHAASKPNTGEANANTATGEMPAGLTPAVPVKVSVDGEVRTLVKGMEAMKLFEGGGGGGSGGKGAREERSESL